jgi:demethylmenaquinone methyltransferase/2-methoxy-6-polyprenyl-1,4-benzoquinol methylase
VADVETHFEKQDLSTPLRNPAIRQAIQMFDLPEGSVGLDAGCGIGSHTLLLAEAVGPSGHVTGLDLFAEFVAHARDQAKLSGFSNRATFRQGNVSELPFDDASFDWAWSVDCVGQISIGKPLDGLRELARVVRPGGRVAILGYSSQMLLPGYAALEARLNATASATTALAAGKEPEAHFTRALGWFRAAGFAEPRARTVVGTVHAPLDDGVRCALISLFGMLWGEMQSRMDDADREEYLRLTEPEAPDFILNTSDYYAFFTYSMFEGRVTDAPRAS